jgi:UDP-N-acetylglucosamine--N-acetylmuramyl-(pentapeptide) pyrophosphoryl-undecaprenol N-acetylglucosamine transferase
VARAAGLRLETIRARGVQRSIKGLAAVPVLAAGFLAARRILKRERPSVVVGMGGFVSAPVLAAARSLRIPHVLHEQNAVPGLANRMFAKRAGVVCLTFEESASHIAGARTVVVGDPVRPEMLHPIPHEEARSRLGFPPGEPLLLAFGGSRGAQRINRALVDAYPLWRTPGPHILHVAGRIEYEETARALERARAAADAPGRPDHRIVPYIDAMATAYGCADLVLSRAGATTIAELTVLGAPSVLVPYPYATEDHQRRNAEALEAAGAAVVVDDTDLNGEELVRVVEGLLAEPGKLERMSEAARAWGRPDAAVALADQVMRVAVGGRL